MSSLNATALITGQPLGDIVNTILMQACGLIATTPVAERTADAPPSMPKGKKAKAKAKAKVAPSAKKTANGKAPRKARVVLTDEMRALVRTMAEQGDKPKQIASTLGVSIGSVYNTLRKEKK